MAKGLLFFGGALRRLESGVCLRKAQILATGVLCLLIQVYGEGQEGRGDGEGAVAA